MGQTPCGWQGVVAPRAFVSVGLGRALSGIVTHGYRGGVGTMLDAVVRTIEKLQERIRAHRDFVGQYEHRTRAALIDPLLYALG